MAPPMPRQPAPLIPRHVRDVATDSLAELLRDQPMSQQKLEFAWRAAAGPAVARLSAIGLDGDTLRVAVPGPLWALEIERAAPAVLQRLAQLLGSGVVARLDVHSPAGDAPRRRRIRK